MVHSRRKTRRGVVRLNRARQKPTVPFPAFPHSAIVINYYSVLGIKSGGSSEWLIPCVKIYSKVHAWDPWICLQWSFLNEQNCPHLYSSHLPLELFSFDFNVPSTAQGHLRTTHSSFTPASWHKFSTSGPPSIHSQFFHTGITSMTKSTAKSWTTAPDTTQLWTSLSMSVQVNSKWENLFSTEADSHWRI